MTSIQEAAITCDEGVQGDFRGRPGPRQVTVLTREAWDDACGNLGIQMVWTTRRANLFFEGLDLRYSTQKILSLGRAVLEITGETKPCSRMDKAHWGLRPTLTPFWRGGVTCRVITGGRIRVGDVVRLSDRDHQAEDSKEMKETLPGRRGLSRGPSER